MPDIRAIRVLCPTCDCLLSVLIDGGDARSLRIPDGAIAAGVREHVDCAHPQAEPEPDVPPTTVTIHVHFAEGGVLTERQLGDMVERAMLRAGMRNPTTYAPFKR